jgi:hypothetical protein
MDLAMRIRFVPLRLLAPLGVVLALAACQAGLDSPAERAQPASVPPAVPGVFDPDACWAQDRVPTAAGLAEDRLFAVPCPGVLNADFWSSVQRALAVRGLYTGPVTGHPGPLTAEAVRRFQAPLGLDSPILSLEGARQLGLLSWPRSAL